MDTDKNLIDLPREEVVEFYSLNKKFENASGRKRGEVIIDLLMFTYKKLGMKMTKAIIKKYMKDDPLNQLLILMVIKTKCEKENEN